MNSDNPPPLSDSPQPQYAGTDSGGGNGMKIVAGCGLGCLVSLIICAVVGFFVFKGIKEKVSEAAGAYTSATPVEIVAPETPQPVIDDAVSRFDAFRAAMAAGEATEPLVLSEADINALIYNHPSFKAVAGKGLVSIQDNKLTSTISLNLDDFPIPVKFIADAVKGRYFNGVATFSLGMAAGRPALYIEDLNFNGTPLPREIMEGFRQENLLKEAASEPEVQGLFEKISDIRIEYDQLKITPKSGAVPAE